MVQERLIFVMVLDLFLLQFVLGRSKAMFGLA